MHANAVHKKSSASCLIVQLAHLGHDVFEELKDDPARRLAADRHIKVRQGIARIAPRTLALRLCAIWRGRHVALAGMRRCTLDLTTTGLASQVLRSTQAPSRSWVGYAAALQAHGGP